ncbi:uncharacterized protein BO72DRAFT_527908 [Aspergillus fijiensis CBS 313.89]|uniref:Uncharacterized protein n=1 Tax=Aspergillus fijiensis CBS 313.89 TaxID=1448319 RepID=A0A8G1RQY7_9EURO|nr:uncharacterized protein BO72DRAFT_527908 [Aspergillus fijiensis CBS 313.89]RAK77143.1 hypothetical protein BO72DRAFT_527908 [Aspergillus fijiensis CBS 313.89]
MDKHHVLPHEALAASSTLSTPFTDVLSQYESGSPAGFAHWAYDPSPYWKLIDRASTPAEGTNPLPSPTSHVIPTPRLIQPQIVASFAPANLKREPSPNMWSKEEPQARKPTVVVVEAWNMKDSPAKISRFADVDLDYLEDVVVLFCFGVLTTQALLLPRFQFNFSKSRRWGVKLTMYGHTIIKSTVYDTQKEAKSDVCRAALNKLQLDFPDWILPDDFDNIESSAHLTSFPAEFCTHNGFELPRYTRIMHGNEIYHKVQVHRTTYTGRTGTYAEEELSRRSCALLALRHLYIDGSETNSNLSGTLTLEGMDARLLALVPRDPVQARTYIWGNSNHAKASRKKTKRERIVQFQKKKRPIEHKPSAGFPNEVDGNRKRPKSVPRNSNMLPLQHSRLASIEVPAEKEEKRWAVMPCQIQRQIHDLASSTERLQKVCDLLRLEYPEIRVDRQDGRLVDTRGEYTAGAYFKTDPFLRRAGAVGPVTGLQDSRSLAEQACAEEVIKYLIRMVEEDEELETKIAKQRQSVEQWKAKNEETMMHDHQ